MPPAQIVDEVKKSNLRGRGGAGFPTGMKWTLRPQGQPQAQVTWSSTPTSPSRAPARTARSSSYDPHMLIEGIAHRLLRARRAHRLHLHPRRDDARGASVCRRRSTRRTRRACSARRLRAAGDFKLDITCTGAPARTSAARRPALLNSLEGKKGWPAPQAAVPGGGGPLRHARPSSTTSRRMANVPAIIQHGRRLVRRRSASASRAARASSASRATVNRPGVYELPMAATTRDTKLIDRRGLRAGMPAAAAR